MWILTGPFCEREGKPSIHLKNVFEKPLICFIIIILVQEVLQERSRHVCYQKVMIILEK